MVRFQKGRKEIFVRIWVERDSQKGIIIGKRGSKLKEIGTAARRDIAEMLGERVYLDIRVSVRAGWTNNPARLRELGH